jgi:hypothetical protein
MMLATQYAEYYKIEAQREGESDLEFRSRVSGALRDQGKLIEAHEAYQDKRWDELGDEMVNTGIKGAIAQMMAGVDYHVHGEQQIGADIAAGIIVQNPEPEVSPDMLLMAMPLFGRGK